MKSSISIILKKNSLLLLSALVLCGMLVVGCSDSGSKKDHGIIVNIPGTTEAELDHNGVLKALGVDTNIGSRLDPTGKALPENYNPIVKPVTQFRKQCEIFIAGLNGSQVVGRPNWTPANVYSTGLDWAQGASYLTPSHISYSSSDTSQNDDWLKTQKTVTSGDVDGDGKDEIFIAYLKPSAVQNTDWYFAFRVIKKTGDNYSILKEGIIGEPFANSAITEYLTTGISSYYINYWWMNNFNSVCGDADGNGQSETLITFNGNVYLIGDNENNFTLLNYKQYTKPGNTYILLKVASSDLDNNGKDEFVVVQNIITASTNDADWHNADAAVYHIYKGTDLSDMTDPDTIHLLSGLTLHTANCAVGDIDGDRFNEVMFIGQKAGETNYNIVFLDPVNNTTGILDFKFKEISKTFASGFPWSLTPICAIADFDGDGLQEFIGYGYMYDNLSQTDNEITQLINFYEPLSRVGTNRGSLWDWSLATGDIDGDNRADVSLLQDGANPTLYCLGYDYNNNWVIKDYGCVNSPYTGFGSITMGDYDGDSITVEYQESELIFSNPHPIAVLAANPFWTGIEMDGSTWFGTSSGTEEEKETQIGFKTGYSIGYESEGIFDIWTMSFKASFESSFDWTATQAVSIEESYTYSTGNEDKVIFSCIPYDIYYYKVLQSPDSEKIGMVFSVNLPRKPITLPVERGFYNNNNGGLPDIDSTVPGLDHIIGTSLSYPTSIEADQLIQSGSGQGIKSGKMMTVGQGTGSTSIEMSVTNSEGYGEAFDFAVDIEAEAGAFGATAGISVRPPHPFRGDSHA